MKDNPQQIAEARRRLDLFSEATDLLVRLVEISDDPQYKQYKKRVKKTIGPAALRRAGRRLRNVVELTGLQPILIFAAHCPSKEFAQLILSMALSARVEITTTKDLPPELKNLLGRKRSIFEDADESS